ncbi:MAG: pyridoxamine 5'-phosphate oxidase family protein [Syntrophales bacterium]
MRRADKEITERKLIDSIIHKSLACRIAMCDGKMPYVIPMSFGYDGKNIYLHSAKEGRKIEILKGNPLVCFEFETDCEVIPTPRACSFTMRYKTVIGLGTVCFIEDIEEKITGLRIIVRQYTDKIITLTENDLEKITVIRINIEQITGKQSGFKSGA